MDLQNLTSALCVYLGDNGHKVNVLSATKQHFVRASGNKQKKCNTVRKGKYISQLHKQIITRVRDTGIKDVNQLSPQGLPCPVPHQSLSRCPEDLPWQLEDQHQQPELPTAMGHLHIRAWAPSTQSSFKHISRWAQLQPGGKGDLLYLAHLPVCQDGQQR